jgi:hypothetical protein
VQHLCVFACGRSFTYRGPQGDDSGRFCSSVCQKAHDSGFQQEPPLDVFAVKAWKIIAGPPGAEIGASYEPISRKRKKRSAKPGNDELIRPRRLCVKCGAKLPVWVNGKKARKTQKYCLGCSR